MSNPSTSSRVPFKSVAGGLLFAVILGPVGLLYASFWGGVTMIVIGFIVCSSRFFIPILLVWLISCMWSVHAINRYNNKIVELLTQ